MLYKKDFVILFLVSCLFLLSCKTDKNQTVEARAEADTQQETRTQIPASILNDTMVVTAASELLAEKQFEQSEDSFERANKTIKKDGPKSKHSPIKQKESSIPEVSSELPQQKTAEKEKQTEEAVGKVNTNGSIVKEGTEQVDDLPTAKPIEENLEKEKEKGKEETEVEEPAIELKLDHGNFDKLLRKYVSANGKVNYKGWMTEKDVLLRYTQELANNYPDPGSSKNSSLAYFINAYNAFTVLLILDNYPLGSIMDLDGGKPWDRKWIKLGNKTLSLNEIENGILRSELKESRIHFAVNCAAKSCPPLSNKAFTESNVQALLEKRTREFINDGSQNTFSGKTIELSKIFDWYKEDFGDILAYVNRYRDSKTPTDSKIIFKEYDWKLNE